MKANIKCPVCQTDELVSIMGEIQEFICGTRITIGPNHRGKQVRTRNSHARRQGDKAYLPYDEIENPDLVSTY